jgi:hypothetical protein
MKDEYDYTNCGDSEWEQLVSDRESLDRRTKDREDFLKTIPATGINVVEKMTGYLVTLYPPSKT